LRKHDAKEFVTIIDFIGNYKNNYLIPVALSGDKSLNKDNIRRKIEDTSYIKGVSTINFEEVAKEQIYKSINVNNLTELKKLKEAFIELKNRIGRLPLIYDFIENDSIDPVVIVKAHNSYHHFLLRVGEKMPSLSVYEEQVLVMLSNEILPGKRSHEVLLLEMLILNGHVPYEQYITKLQQSGCLIDNATLSSVARTMDLSFFVQAQRVKYGSMPICIFEENSTIRINESIQKSLKNNKYFKDLIVDIVKSAIENKKNYDGGSPLTLHRKYTRKDVCRLLNWDSDESSTVYGYKTKFGTCPIFVTYHKHDDVEASVKYEDELVARNVLKWYTRSNRTLQSEEVKQIIKAKDNGISVHIFVKKDDDEGSDFYYLGEANPDQSTVEQKSMSGKDNKEIPVVSMDLVLEHPVESRLYYYLKAGGKL